MITAIAIDDEPLALEVVKKHAQKVPFLELKAVFTNAFDALNYLGSHHIDLLFLDIKMPDISGIEFYNSLNRKPHVIFTTAYSEHAVTGFELNATDYLLKPFSLSRFLKACNKVQELESLRNPQKEKNINHVYIKRGYEQIRISFDDIDYLEATGNYVTFVLGGQHILSRMTITECENLLPESDFIRIHRSFIIAKDKIQRIEKHQMTLNGHLLPIGNSYAQALSERIK